MDSEYLRNAVTAYGELNISLKKAESVSMQIFEERVRSGIYRQNDNVCFPLAHSFLHTRCGDFQVLALIISQPSQLDESELEVLRGNGRHTSSGLEAAKNAIIRPPHRSDLVRADGQGAFE